MRLRARVSCLRGCGVLVDWTYDLAAADLAARKHTGEGSLKGGPNHPTRCEQLPERTP